MVLDLNYLQNYNSSTPNPFLLCLPTVEGCVEAVLASAEYPTHLPIVVALAVFLSAMCLTALASFLHLLNFYSQAESFRFCLNLHLLLHYILFIFESMSISSQSLNNSLLMLGALGSVSTVIASAQRSTE